MAKPRPKYTSAVELAYTCGTPARSRRTSTLPLTGALKTADNGGSRRGRLAAGSSIVVCMRSIECALGVHCGKGRARGGCQTVRAGDRRARPDHRDIAMVFQSYALYPHMNVYDNIGFALRMMRVPRAEIERRVKWAAEMLGIAELLHRKPRQLSGGQRQRVALGRSVVREPACFLLDEPLSNLDAQLRVTMRGELKRLHLELKRTFIYVTHDQAEALTMSDRIAVISDGRLQQYGPPDEIYNRPRNVFVAGFMGSPTMNLIRGTLVSSAGTLCFSAPGLDQRLRSEE